MPSTANEIKPGDYMVCVTCGVPRIVEQEWMESIKKELVRKDKWINPPGSSFADVAVAAIPVTLLKHLTCRKCRGVGAVKLQMPLPPPRVRRAEASILSAPKEPGIGERHDRCTVCGHIAIPGDTLCNVHAN